MSESIRSYLRKDADRLAAVVETLQYAYGKSRFFERLFAKRIKNNPITPELVGEMFFSLPFCSKEDVVRNYPHGFLAAPLQDVVLCCESSGTSGDTTGSTRAVSYFTRRDLERDAQRRFSPDLALSAQDVVAVALPYALTSSALGFHRAAEQASATVIPLDSGSLLSSQQKHLDVVKGLGVTVLISSMPLMYSTMVQSRGEDVKAAFGALRAVQLCGLATLEHGMAKVKERLGADVYNTYGMSEFGALTFTCRAGRMHVHDDFFVETINPRNGESVDDPVQGGEVVVTTLRREGSPKIRYRTGDFGHLDLSGTCECGRATPTLRVRGRMRDAIQLGERFWLPIDFEEVLLSHPATTGMCKLRYEPKDEDGNVDVKALVDVENATDTKLVTELEALLTERIHPGIRVELRRCGGSHEEFLEQSRFANVRSLKTLTLDDGRPEEWLVSY